MIRHQFACLAISLLISGCSNRQGEEFFPALRDGSQQVYALEYRTSLGVVQKGKVVDRIDGVETIKGNKYFKLVTVSSGIPGYPTLVQYVRIDTQGKHVIEGDDDTKTEYTEIPFPVKVGKTWTVKKPKGDWHYTAEGIETLHLIDRKYEGCLKLLFKAQNLEGYAYFAPGAGEVKGVCRIGEETMELVLEK